VVIVRDDQGVIRAFHNVCRHRGTRLVHDPKSTVGTLVCRYHQWSYALDGELLFAEHMGAGFPRDCHGLKPVHIRSLAGLLFICLAQEPPADFDDMARVMDPYIAQHEIPSCKIAKEMDLIEPGNWKLTMENNRECYHCVGSHPELIVPLFEYGFGFAPDATDANRREQIDRYQCLVTDLHARWEADGLPSREVDHLDDRVTGFRTQRLPIDGCGESETIDTRIASQRLLGNFTNPKLGGLSFWVQPNSWHHFMSDHIVTFSVTPLDPEHTLVKTKWLVHKDAVEGVDYDLENLTKIWTLTNAQDAQLVGFAQSGVRDPAYEPGPYSPHTEGLVEKFCNWYMGRLSAHLSR
jgi:Rieske 2Fe-2S family protein